jgi:cytochrome c oxidase subunit 4
MAERITSAGTYVVVCGVLILLTFLTVGISFCPVAGIWHLVLGLLIGGCKAALVALFFMHLMHSPRVTWLVVTVACFWLSILLVLTLSDYFTRGLVPYMPGH